jgi:hypothetical protein
MITIFELNNNTHFQNVLLLTRVSFLAVVVVVVLKYLNIENSEMTYWAFLRKSKIINNAKLELHQMLLD